MVLNAAARFVVGAGKFQHITPVLRDVLHWLPVRQRILYKVAATAFDCIRGTGPAYFKHVCTPASDMVGHTSVLLNAATCWYLAPKLSSADGVFQLLHRPSGTLFRHICARH